MFRAGLKSPAAGADNTLQPWAGLREGRFLVQRYTLGVLCGQYGVWTVAWIGLCPCLIRYLGLHRPTGPLIANNDSVSSGNTYRHRPPNGRCLS